jgi:hypothetical protein
MFCGKSNFRMECIADLINVVAYVKVKSVVFQKQEKIRMCVGYRSKTDTRYQRLFQTSSSIAGTTESRHGGLGCSISKPFVLHSV